MSYFPNNVVGFQVPANSTLVAQSFPDHFYYPFESQHLHHLPPRPLTPTDHHFHQFSSTVQNVPPSTRSRRGRRSRSSKCPGGNKDNNNVQNRSNPEADERIRHERVTKRNQENSSTADYIHVRARRGQATDTHSLAERVRREKISERMQTLQSLVPGCDKYLSMKLASISPMYNNEIRQDQNENHDRLTQPTMDANASATTLAEQQLLENSNLLQQVETLFAQDGSNEVLPWDLEDQFLNQNVIDFDVYEQTNAQA